VICALDRALRSVGAPARFEIRVPVVMRMQLTSDSFGTGSNHRCTEYLCTERTGNQPGDELNRRVFVAAEWMIEQLRSWSTSE
jgi:hypothetical protein